MRLQILTIAVLAVGLCGCGITRPFKASRRIDMAPFAENTISLVAEISYGLNHKNSAYLGKYADGPPIVEYREHWLRMRSVLRGVATYSLALVTISKSNLTEEERLEQLATFLDRMFRPVVQEPVHEFSIGPEELDRILADIRDRKNFLDGIGSAQPLIDEVANYSGAYLDIIKDSEQAAAAWLLEQITRDNADVVGFDELLREAQARSFRSLVVLAKYRQSQDEADVERLRVNDPQLEQFMPDRNQLSADEIKEVEDRLVFRLSELRDLKAQIAVDIEKYDMMVRELDGLVTAASQNLVRTRATIWVWSRTHARLAAGITDPAEVDIMGIAKRALNAALPM